MKMKMGAYMGGEVWGSPQGQFEIPAGLVAATPSFAMAASRYMAEYGVSEETLAKVAVDSRYNAQANPMAVFYGKPITIDDVMSSRYVADPLKLLEIVMPCYGGSAVLVTTAERGRSGSASPGLCKRLRRASHPQEHHLCPRHRRYPHPAGRRPGVRYGRGVKGGGGHGFHVRLLHHHRVVDHRGRRVLPQGARAGGSSTSTACATTATGPSTPTAANLAWAKPASAEA